MSARSEVKRSLEELVALPWSREVVADEDGVFIASVPELEGCFADGDTVEQALAALDEVLRDWLELALDEDTEIPEPRRQPSDLYSGRFSVRIPRSLHRELSERAEAEGASLNQFVAVLLASGLRSAVRDRPLRTSMLGDRQVHSDVHEEIASDALRGTRDSIGALKGIATFLRDRGDVNFACLMFGLTAERIAVIEGAGSASHELGAAAALARRHVRPRLAESLWRGSLRCDPTNLRSSSALGQLLHHQGRYHEAVNYLEPPASRDNYALLFLGWSLLFDGRESEDPEAVHRGRMSIVAALEKWSYQNRDSTQRDAWLRHVRRLASLGPDWRHESERLITFANSHSSWPRTENHELLVGSDRLDEGEQDLTALG